MSTCNSAVGIFSSHELAEQAVQELKRSNFDIKRLSIMGRDYHSDEQVVGYYNTGDRMKYWGKQGAFWGGLWGLLFGAGFFLVPGIGPLLVAGPIVTSIIGAIEGAAVVGGMSVVGAALYGLGIPKNSVIRYETAIKMGKYVVIFHGSPEEVESAKRVLEGAKAAETVVHVVEVPVRGVNGRRAIRCVGTSMDHEWITIPERILRCPQSQPRRKHPRHLRAPPTPHAGSCGAGQSCPPTHEEIARRTYDIYVKTGRQEGQCTQNWHQAEKSLRDRSPAARPGQPTGSGTLAPPSTAGPHSARPTAKLSPSVMSRGHPRSLQGLGFCLCLGLSSVRPRLIAAGPSTLRRGRVRSRTAARPLSSPPEPS